MTLEDKCVDAIAGIRFETISGIAVERAKIGMSDVIGVALPGSREDIAVAAARVTNGNYGNDDVILWGTGRSAPLLDAVYVNAVAAHALDWDDYSHPMHGHCSAVLTPVCLSLGEKYKLSGRQIIEAYLIGHEVNALVGETLGVAHYNRGWHATSTIGVLGAAAAAARLLGLSRDTCLMALGIAASHAAGVRANFGSMTKPLHVGQAARAGVLSALLAREGVTASPQALTNRNGFCDLFQGRSGEEEEHHDGRRGLSIEGDWGLVLKPHACCGSSHPAIDATLGLMREFKPDIDDIVSIDCRIAPMVAGILIYNEPRDSLTARYSLQYPVAIAILEGRASAAEFTDERVGRADVQALMKRIRVVTDMQNSADQEFAAEVSITVKGGERLHRAAPYALGHPLNPMKPQDRAEKFYTATGNVLSPERSRRLLAAMSALENCTDVSAVSALMRP